MVSKKFIIKTFISALTLALSFSLKPQDSFASAAETCKSAAASKYGALYTYQKDTFDYRCDHDMGGDGNYGTAVPTNTSYQEWTRLSDEDLSFNIARVIYSVGTNGYSTGSDASGCIENNVSNAEITGSSMELMQLKAGTKRTWVGTGTYHIGMSATAIKGGWSNLGGTATVTFSPNYISSNASVDSNGLVSTNFKIKTHLYCYDKKNADNQIYYRFYKITRIIHGSSPKASFGGSDYYSSSTSQSSPITVTDGKITFTHQLIRNDGWDNPSSAALTQVYKRTITAGSTTAKSDSSWQSQTFGTRGSSVNVTDQIDVSNLNLQPNVATQICSTVTHRKVKGLHGHTANNDNATNVDTSTVCVWVKDDRIFLNSSSQSFVDNSIANNNTNPATPGNSKSVESWGGSRGGAKTYTYSFTHKLQVKETIGYSQDMEYYIVHTENGTQKSIAGQGSASSPNSVTINSSAASSFTPVFTYSDSFPSAISAGEQTPTICETIYFRPKRIEVKLSTGVKTTKDNSWQSSTVCTKVQRRSTKTSNLSGTCSVSVNGDSSGQVVTSTNPNFAFQFGFNITRNNTNQSLNTTYTIKRSINGGTESPVKTNTIAVPKNGLSDSPTITFTESEHGTSKKVCESIYVNPSSYTIHHEANGNESTVQSSDANNTEKLLATCCATAAMPKREPRDDGEITVHSDSAGSLDDQSQTGGQITVDGKNAWLMKTEKATITYTHQLWRNAEKHTGDGTHQASVRSPEEDVDVNYRFDIQNTTFAATSITNAHHAIIATNTEGRKYQFKSNRTDPLLNINTEATADEVGKLNTYCQSIHYLSSKYTLRGIYWQIDGVIFDKDPSLQGVEPPVSKGTVGKSAQGCVNVIRPWNFRATSLVPTGDYSKPVIAESSDNSATFNLHVNKDKSDYLITDIPNATIRFVAFVVEGNNASATNYAGSLDSTSDPCAHFTAQTGSQCSPIGADETRNLGPSGATGKKKYTNATYGNSGYDVTLTKNNIAVPKLSTNQKYCIAVGVKPASSGDGFNMSSNWAISDATCFNIGKYPNFQAWGGSIFTNGGTKTSITKTTVNGTEKVFGSWGDFALIANGTINKTASGATLISGLGASNYNNCTSSPLTIANHNCNVSGTNTNPALGGASINVDAANFKEKLADRYLIDPSKYNVMSEVTTENLRNGRSPFVIYNPNGDIYIKNNISISAATRSYGNANVPQVIIIAKGNILIDQSVAEVNAWLIADGIVNTCVEASTKNTPALSSTVCDTALTISGPVVASKVYFNRTAGADAYYNSLPNYAELVNLNSAVYLFSANEASGAQPITTYIQKLPPRY